MQINLHECQDKDRWYYLQLRTFSLIYLLNQSSAKQEKSSLRKFSSLQLQLRKYKYSNNKKNWAAEYWVKVGCEHNNISEFQRAACKVFLTKKNKIKKNTKKIHNISIWSVEEIGLKVIFAPSNSDDRRFIIFFNSAIKVLFKWIYIRGLAIISYFFFLCSPQTSNSAVTSVWGILKQQKNKVRQVVEEKKISELI